MGEPAEATWRQVRRTAAALRERARIRDRVDSAGLAVAGAVCDLDSGRVELLP